MSSSRRTLLIVAGFACVVLGAAGVFLPVLPTTPFLLLAAWCFARSDPELGRRVLAWRIFRPYRAYLDGTRPIPERARWYTIAIVWTVVGLSAAAIPVGRHTWILLGAALVGTVVILRWRRPARARTGGALD